MYVVPVLDGPARLAHRPHRRAAHRQRLRRGQHEDHDPHGPGRPRRPRCRRRLGQVPALGRLPAGRRRRQRAPRRGLAVRRRQQVHLPLPRRPRDLVVRLGLRRQRPARQEVLRPAHRLDHGPRRGLDGRAHAHHRRHAARSARRSTSPRRSRRRAARPTWPCSSPPCPGWKVECVGDDIAWLKFGDDGQLYAINPEAGFFGVAPGTSAETNLNALRSVDANSIFTNVAKTDDGDVWWEGLSEPPAHLIDWKGNDWTPESDAPAAHPNARFTAPAAQCPAIAPEFDDPKGVPISAILFGGRRAIERPAGHRGPRLGARRVPRLDHELGEDGRRGRQGRRGPLRPLRHAALHRLQRRRLHAALARHRRARTAPSSPKLFWVNWFRRGEDGSFLWPGFGDNSRVLKWVLERLETGESADAVETPIGLVPTADALDTDGLDIDADVLAELLSVDAESWRQEIPLIEEHFDFIGERLPGHAARRSSKSSRSASAPEPDSGATANRRSRPIGRGSSRSGVQPGQEPVSVAGGSGSSPRRGTGRRGRRAST